MAEDSNTAFAISIGIGIGLIIAFVAVEAIYDWKINAFVLLADAGHSVSDADGPAFARSGNRRRSKAVKKGLTRLPIKRAMNQ